MAEILLTDVLIGAVSGAVLGGSIYLKRRQEGETFDGIKFAGTVVIGAVVGVGLASSGMAVGESTVNDAILFGTTMGFTALIENVFRYFYRMVKGN